MKCRPNCPVRTITGSDIARTIDRSTFDRQSADHRQPLTPTVTLTLPTVHNQLCAREARVVRARVSMKTGDLITGQENADLRFEKKEKDI